MAVPYGTRFSVDFDLVFPQGAYIIGEVTRWITWVIRATGLQAVDGPTFTTSAKSAAA